MEVICNNDPASTPAGAHKDEKVEVICNSNAASTSTGVSKAEKLEVICNMAAMGGGCSMKTPSTMVDRTIARTNAKKLRGARGSMDIRSFVLGTKAPSDILQARAIPDGNSPKRPIPMEIDTPGKKLCSRNPEDTAASSPLLRKNQPVLTAPGTKGKKGNLRRLAARLDWDVEKEENAHTLDKKKNKQPLISAVMSQAKFGQENSGDD